MSIFGAFNIVKETKELEQSGKPLVDFEQDQKNDKKGQQQSNKSAHSKPSSGSQLGGQRVNKYPFLNRHFLSFFFYFSFKYMLSCYECSDDLYRRRV